MIPGLFRFHGKWTITASLVVSLFFFGNLQAQKIELSRIDPPSWWAGMKNPGLQLMVYGRNISQTKPVISYPGVQITEVFLNNTDKEKVLNASRFTENLAGYASGRSVLNRTGYPDLKEMAIPAKSPVIIELTK